MINRLVVKNFGSIKDVDVKLTPLHALIGPNDAGKSTLLRAIHVGTALSREQSLRDTLVQANSYAGKVGKIRIGSTAQSISLEWSNRWNAETVVELSGSLNKRFQLGRWGVDDVIGGGAHRGHLDLAALLPSSRTVRVSPSAAIKPSKLIPQRDLVTFLDEEGTGLPGVYNAIMTAGHDGYQQIRERFLQLFPAYSRFGARAVTDSTVELFGVLKDGTEVPATQMSTGAIYFLAYAALPYLSKSSPILVEEPENGLHPARIAEVVQGFREITRQHNVQVIMATHSPLVINELKPEEVTIVSKPSVESGTTTTPLVDTPNFDARAEVYSLGELWLSYCDGETDDLAGPVHEGGEAAQ